MGKGRARRKKTRGSKHTSSAAKTIGKVTAVEKSVSLRRIALAIDPLKRMGGKKELRVPTRLLEQAKQIATAKGVKLTIHNLSRTRRKFVRGAPGLRKARSMS